MADSTIRISRSFDFRLALCVPLALMLALLVFNSGGLDFTLENLFYEPGLGFVGRHSLWLEDILHDRAKQAVILLGILIIIGFVLSMLPTRIRAWRRVVAYLVLALGFPTCIVTPLTILTDVHCP